MILTTCSPEHADMIYSQQSVTQNFHSHAVFCKSQRNAKYLLTEYN